MIVVGEVAMHVLRFFFCFFCFWVGDCRYIGVCCDGPHFEVTMRKVNSFLFVIKT